MIEESNWMKQLDETKLENNMSMEPGSWRGLSGRDKDSLWCVNHWATERSGLSAWLSACAGVREARVTPGAQRMGGM